MKKTTADKIIDTLLEVYHDTKCTLDFTSPYTLLVATILSAQCTDIRVNIVTKELFKVASTPLQMVELGETKLRRYIQSCGLSNTKAKNIIATSMTLLEQYSGEVPSTFDELTKLNGVGRKTANVLLSNVFNTPSIAVDTHVFRVANRIGLASSSDVVKTEKMLMDIIDIEKWSPSHHVIVRHGRTICHARNVDCEICCIKELCEKHI